MNSISRKIKVFHGRIAPEEGLLVGYGAIIEYFDLKMAMPHKLVIISNKNRKYSDNEWLVLTPRHKPEDNLHKHLVFAIKYEGIDLLFFRLLFDKVKEAEIIKIISLERYSAYNRIIWFLYEFLKKIKLPIEDLDKGNYINLINEESQFAIENGIKSSRHRVINNLPGNTDFCPMIFKSPKLMQYINSNFDDINKLKLNKIRKDILQRTSAFLLLKDSKASFTIEGENPIPTRAMKWGRAIGEAGKNELSKEEFLRLQQMIIEKSKFVKYGYRDQGGFIGEHDRDTFQPLPDHISAKHEDIQALMSGLLQSETLMHKSKFHPVLAASVLAFGFVFIHPLEDGNGRIHRYIIHHILSKYGFTPQGIIFPVSAAILNRITDYGKILEKYSHSILPFIDWKTTAENNVEVLNDTRAYYSYFDATPFAEFIFECIEDTIENLIPQEINYLQRYDEFKTYVENKFEMPDKLIGLLVQCLEQNEGKLSKSKKENHFKVLTQNEVKEIEEKYNEIFNGEQE